MHGSLVAGAAQSSRVIHYGNKNSVLLSDVTAQNERWADFGRQSKVNLPDLTALDAWHRPLPVCPKRALLPRRSPSFLYPSSCRALDFPANAPKHASDSGGAVSRPV